MSRRNMLQFIVAGCLAGTSAALARELTVATAPPVIVKTVPEAGAIDVDPGLTSIRVTFSKPMLKDQWSWVKEPSTRFPEVRKDQEIRFEADGRTCILPVKLAPGTDYVLWLNSEGFRDFKDREGRSAIPYLLVFKTREASGRR